MTLNFIIASEVVFLALALVSSAYSQDKNAAMALLLEAEHRRAQITSLRLEMDVEGKKRENSFTRHWVLDLDRDKLRSEVTSGDSKEYAARDGQEVIRYRVGNHNDLDVYEFKDAGLNRSLLMFDPRILGIGEFLSCDLTVSDCLWRSSLREPHIAGEETIRGALTQRVATSREETIFNFWIEDSTFRVHRVTYEIPGRMLIEIDSEFDNSSSPIPVRVTTTRYVVPKGGGETDKPTEIYRQYHYTVKKLQTGITFPDDHFTMASFHLPINTMINDYRISRITGYWDGKKSVPNPLSPAERVAAQMPLPPAAIPNAVPGPSATRWWLISVNVLVLAIAAVIALFRWRQRAKT